MYCIKSLSVSRQFYNVNILAHSCRCCDYPEINISLPSRYFPSPNDATSSGLDALADLPSSLLSSPSPDNITYQPPMELSLVAGLSIEEMDADDVSLKEKEQDHLCIVMMLETLAACMHHNNASAHTNHTGGAWASTWQQTCSFIYAYFFQWRNTSLCIWTHGWKLRLSWCLQRKVARSILAMHMEQVSRVGRRQRRIPMLVVQLVQMGKLWYCSLMWNICTLKSYAFTPTSMLSKGCTSAFSPAGIS